MAKSYFPTLFGQCTDDGRLFRSLKSDIDRVFRDFDHVGLPVFARQGELGLHPSVDIVESDKAVDVVVELPGVEIDDLDIQATGSPLMIKGEKKAEYDREDRNIRVVERSFGSFSRAIPLAFQIEQKGVDATFDNGVLTITVTKPEEIVTKTHSIKITKARITKEKT